MPCDCSHLEASYDETQSRETCKHICYLFKQLNMPVPSWVKSAANEYYGNPRKLIDAETLLYNTLTKLNKSQLNDIVYNGRLQKSRDLANWYDDRTTKIQEKQRFEREQIEKRKRAESLLSKYREGEVEIIKEYFEGRYDTGTN